MRHQLTPHLVFGDDTICTDESSGTVAVVHACKEPCHRSALGYSGRSLPSSHPHYLVLEQDFHLFLNLIDPPTPLFMMPSFHAFLAFVDRHVANREVIIHCNLGESRAPSLALLYLAKRIGALPNDSYESAAVAFQERFPYSPGLGIRTWLSRNWGAIR